MAKKFVRGITDIKNIEHQDFDTNNVNDLLSDGQNNYIHRKKGNTEEYHNLTNNIKTIESSNTSLLSVTNYNNSTNSAKLTPKHDRRKEQLLESTDNTILIEHGENGTEETTSVDVNPTKVLEHDNLISDSEYITLDHQTGENTTHIQTTALNQVLQALNHGLEALSQGLEELYQIISASTIKYYLTVGLSFEAFKQVVTSENDTFVTFTFSCQPEFSERVLTGDIKNDLEKFVRAGMTVSNGAISITNDGTSMKLINSAYSEELGHYQQGTFTFYDGGINS